MTQRDIATLVDTTGQRYRLRSWRSGSRKTSEPKRPAQLYEKEPDEAGWSWLDSWNAAQPSDNCFHAPKPDDQVLQEAITRLKAKLGVTVEKVILDKQNGWGHETSGEPNVDAEVVELAVN